MNLDDNIIVQIGSTILLVGICFIWGIQFFVLGFAATGHATVGWKSVAAFSSNLSTAIGVILFNFAWGVTVPSWINEMKPGVSVNKSLWWSSFISLVCFMLTGLLPALTVTFTKAGEDLLTPLSKLPDMWAISNFTAQLFPPAVLLPGIPIFSIMVRYNLLENKLCNKFWANMFAVVFPWVASLIFYAGNFLNIVLNWAAILVQVPLNFQIPCLIYLATRNEPYLDNGEVLGHEASHDGNDEADAYVGLEESDGEPARVKSLDMESGSNSARANSSSGILSRLSMHEQMSSPEGHYFTLPKSLRSYGGVVAWTIIVITTVVDLAALVFAVQNPTGN